VRYKTIPKTDLRASHICMGGGAIGISLDERESFRMLDTFVDLGGNFIDTANIYGKWLPHGRNSSEEMIGKWLKKRNNRDRIILATKGAHPNLNTMDIPRLGRREIREDLEESLDTLQTDTIDMYWLHRDDENRPVGDILETMNELVSEGKIRYFGCSNWKPNRIAEALNYAEQNGMKSFVANQVMWSLAEPDMMAVADKTLVAMDKEGLDFHKKTNMAAVPYSSQANGYFTKLAKGGPALLDDRVKRIYHHKSNIQRMERILKLAREMSCTVTEIALAYLISHDFPTFPIVGCRSVDQLMESMKAGDLVLDAERMDYLNSGTGGEG
jgi:aryl-alcohol dehydrogenase-like predicted oxidoreductase